MRRIVVLIVAVLALMAMALPVLAQSEPSTEGITVAELATVPGAVVVSSLVVSVVGVLVSLSSRAKRILAMVVGLVAVVLATSLNGGSGIETYVLATITGMTAGLAASKAQEIGSEGLDHSVSRRA